MQIYESPLVINQEKDAFDVQKTRIVRGGPFMKWNNIDEEIDDRKIVNESYQI